MSDDPLRLRSTATWSGETVDGGPGLEPRPALPVDVREAVAARYVLAEELGRGGMAVVHAAFDRQLARRVAVKLLHPGGGGHGGNARLVREAQALAQLRHPNVVTVFDAGSHDGQMFLAMELVEGDSLRRWMAEPRPWREVVRRFIDAGRGLAAAHAAGLVHRDFKPDNVLLDRDGTARVADFGLARFIGDRDGDDDDDDDVPLDPLTSHEPTQRATALDRTVTRAGAVVGTPPYLAPELMRGSPADARSDQFSFGVSLAEALSGERPYPGRTLDELLRAIEHDPPRLDGVGPAWIRAIVERTLDRDPERRFPSMAAVIEALGRDPAQRRRRWILAGAAVVAMGGGVLGVSALTAGGQEPPSCAALVPSLDGVWDAARRRDLAAHLAGSKLDSAPAIARDLERSFDGYAAGLADGERAACEARRRGSDDTASSRLRTTCLARRRAELAVMVEETLRLGDAELPRAPRGVSRLALVSECADTEVLRRMSAVPDAPTAAAELATLQAGADRARLLVHLAKQQEAVDLLRPLLPRARALGHPPTESEVLASMSAALEGLDQLAEAERYGREALLAAQLGGHDVLFARTAVLLALNIGRVQQRPAEGMTWAELAIATSARLGKPATLEAVTHFAAAVVLMGDHKIDAAEREVRLSIAASGAAGYDDFQLADATNLLGGIHLERGEFEEARTMYQRARELTAARIGENNNAVLVSDSNLGSVALALGDHATAVRLRRRVLTERERLFGPNTPRVSDAQVALAFTLLGAGDHDGAVTAARRGLEIAVASGGGHHPRTAGAKLSLANILHVAGQPDEAATLAAEIEAAAAAIGPGAAQMRASALALLGDLAFDAGKLGEATALYDAAVKLCTELDDRSAALAGGLRGQARIAAHRGDLAGARERYGRAAELFRITNGPRGLETLKTTGELAALP